MNSIHNSMIHYISSSNKESGSNEDFVHKINIPNDHNRISLLNVNFPKSFYLVNSPSNTFKLDAVEHTVNEGVYSVDSFVTAVNTLITPDTIAFVERTGKFTLTSTASNLIFPSTSKMHLLFGFDLGSTNAISTTLTSSYVVNFQALSRLYVLCDLCMDSGSNLFANLLHTFYTNNDPDFSSIEFHNPEIVLSAKKLTLPDSKTQTGSRSVTANFKFINQNGDVLDLNGSGIELSVVTWRSSDMNELIKRYINFKIHQFALEDTYKNS